MKRLAIFGAVALVVVGVVPSSNARRSLRAAGTEIRADTIYSKEQIIRPGASATGLTWEPAIWFEGSNGTWIVGQDIANTVPGRDFVIGKKGWPGCPACISDFMYFNHNGERAATVGIGWAPAPLHYRLNVSGQDDERGMGGIAIRAPQGLMTGHPLAIVGGAGQDRWHIDSDMWMSETRIKTAWNGYALSLSDKQTTPYTFAIYDGRLYLFNGWSRPVLMVSDGRLWVWDGSTWIQVPQNLEPLRQRIASLEARVARARVG